MNMKKKIILRSLIGAPIGVTVSYLITVLISLTIADGNFYPVVPELTADCGSELNAVLLQTVFSLLYGAVWGGASVIWDMESWSLLRMTVTHLVICSTVTFPIAYLMRWMSHNIMGILLYFGIFVTVYALIWISQYQAIKRQIEQINHKMQDKN